MPVPDDKLILLGKIIKVHGYGGSVMISLEQYLPEEIPDMEWVFIEIDEKPVPFFVSSFKEHASGNIILKFDGYDSSEVMTEFIGCRILINMEEMKDKKGIPPQAILTGFKLFDRSENYVGLIQKVLSLPMQYMLVLHDDEGRELLIPLKDDWLIKIDKDEKTIIMDLPDGIIQVNE
jgi:16S rRNA processing protein RimM